jgi:hypothetical protein
VTCDARQTRETFGLRTRPTHFFLPLQPTPSASRQSTDGDSMGHSMEETALLSRPVAATGGGSVQTDGKQAADLDTLASYVHRLLAGAH